MVTFVNSCQLFEIIFLCLAAIVIQSGHASGQSEDSCLLEERNSQPKTVLVALLIRNKAHCLPTFLGSFEKLKYSKSRIALWIRTDHNEDNSSGIIEDWISHRRQWYHSISYENKKEPSGYKESTGPTHWTDDRFTNVMNLRQEALEAGRYMWADYVLYIDVDNIITNENTLQILMDQRKTIVAPMLNCTSSKTYTNFWGGMNDEGYYLRTPDYYAMLERHKMGCFSVAMVHSTFLLNLQHRNSKKLAFNLFPPNYAGPFDDIIIFAHFAKYAGVEMNILNTQFFGFIPKPMDEHHSFPHEREQFLHLKLTAAIHLSNLKRPPMPPKPEFMTEEYPIKDKLGFDEVYCINLPKRKERRKVMEYNFDLLGLDANFVDAVDGSKLNMSYMEQSGMRFLPNFHDPYSKRPMTWGEIGCFLSHYKLWKEIVDKKYSTVLVLEDDVRFTPYFRQQVLHRVTMANTAVKDWDLVYLGRKIMNFDNEDYVKGSRSSLVWPSYTYWTIGYMMTYSGAKKLLDQNPLDKLVPVDEFLPIMYNIHPYESWKEHFHPRNLIALSTAPLLLEPTHYYGDNYYISDTEYSKHIVDAKKDTTGKAKTKENDKQEDKKLEQCDLLPGGKCEDNKHIPVLNTDGGGV